MADAKQNQDTFQRMKGDLQHRIDALKKAGEAPATSLQAGDPVDIIRALLENIDNRLKAIEDAPPGIVAE